MSLRLSLLILVGLGQPLSAQNAKPAAKAESGLIVRLLAQEVSNPQGKVRVLTDAAKSEAIDLPTTALSVPISVASRSLRLQLADNDVMLCSITLPDQGKSFGILLTPEPPAGFVPVVVRLDDPSFKIGDVFFINRAQKTAVIKLGGTELVLEPGKSAKARPTNAVENAYYDVVISERDAKGDKLIASSRWPVDANLRSYVFLTTNPRGRISYRAVDEPMATPGGN